MSIRILLADSLTLMREGVRVLLEKEPGMEVVAEAEDGLAAVQLAQDISPDVVVIEIALPSLGGIGATRQIIDAVPDVKVVALSMYSDRQFVIGMLRAGASGYVLKRSASAQLVRAIKAVVAGQTYLSPAIARVVIEDYVRRLDQTDPSAFSTLSSRQLEVLQLLAEGRDTQQIASCLELSPKTVGKHRRSAMKKLGIHTVAGLIKYAIREGLTSP
jgi:two-component system response regulator NreC